MVVNDVTATNIDAKLVSAPRTNHGVTVRPPDSDPPCASQTRTTNMAEKSGETDPIFDPK